MPSQPKDWKERSRHAFEQYLSELEHDLPTGSTIAEVELKLWHSHRVLLNQIMQARSDSESFPPSQAR